MANPGDQRVPHGASALVRNAVGLATDELAERRRHYDEQVERLLDEPRQRLDIWFEQPSLFGGELRDTPRERRQRHEREEIREGVQREIDRLLTSGDPLIRVLAALVPSRRT